MLDNANQWNLVRFHHAWSGRIRSNLELNRNTYFHTFLEKCDLYFPACDKDRCINHFTFLLNLPQKKDSVMMNCSWHGSRGLTHDGEHNCCDWDCDVGGRSCFTTPGHFLPIHRLACFLKRSSRARPLVPVPWEK